jgi:hypothetical protein
MALPKSTEIGSFGMQIFHLATLFSVPAFRIEAEFDLAFKIQ